MDVYFKPHIFISMSFASITDNHYLVKCFETGRALIVWTDYWLSLTVIWVGLLMCLHSRLWCSLWSWGLTLTWIQCKSTKQLNVSFTQCFTVHSRFASEIIKNIFSKTLDHGLVSFHFSNCFSLHCCLTVQHFNSKLVLDVHCLPANFLMLFELLYLAIRALFITNHVQYTHCRIVIHLGMNQLSIFVSSSSTS